MKSTSIFFAVFVAAVVLGGGWYWYSKSTMTKTPNVVSSLQPNANGEVASMADNTSAATEASAALPMKATVTYDGTSFSPSTVTIAKGGTVTFVDKAGSSMWVASAQHPSHTLYDGTTRQEHCAAGAVASFDQCKGGDTYSFAFDKVGIWPYHDHLNASAFGKVIVQ